MHAPRQNLCVVSRIHPIIIYIISVSLAFTLSAQIKASNPSNSQSDRAIVVDGDATARVTFTTPHCSTVHCYCRRSRPLALARSVRFGAHKEPRDYWGRAGPSEQSRAEQIFVFNFIACTCMYPEQGQAHVSLSALTSYSSLIYNGDRDY